MFESYTLSNIISLLIYPAVFVSSMLYHVLSSENIIGRNRIRAQIFTVSPRLRKYFADLRPQAKICPVDSTSLACIYARKGKVWWGVSPQPTRGLGELHELSKWGPGRRPDRKRILAYFEGDSYSPTAFCNCFIYKAMKFQQKHNGSTSVALNTLKFLLCNIYSKQMQMNFRGSQLAKQLSGDSA